MITLFRIAAAGLASLCLFVAICIAVCRHADPVVLATFIFAAVFAVAANSLNFVNLDGLE